MTNIEETFLRKNRFYVRVKNGSSKTGITTMPRANYVWLKGNTSFRGIPKGYVVHHLDHDQTNDDLSNLVIMYKFHHVAHHLKQKTITTSPECDMVEITHYPINYPYTLWDKKSKRFCVRFMERNEREDKNERVRIFRHNGEPMFTKEQADKCCKDIWDEARGPETTDRASAPPISGP